MKKLALIGFILLSCFGRAQTIDSLKPLAATLNYTSAIHAFFSGCNSTVTSSMTLAQINSTISGCGDGGTVNFAAGTYTVTSSTQIYAACGVTITGPTVTPNVNQVISTNQTAKITGPAYQTLIFLGGSCASSNPTGIEYFDLDTGSGIEEQAGSWTNIVIEHNYFSNLASAVDSSPTMLNFDQGNGNTVSNVTVEYNKFGDSNTCTAINTNAYEPSGDGGCGIQLFQEGPYGSNMVNMKVWYNYFDHATEPFHALGSCFYVYPSNTGECDTNSGAITNPNKINTVDGLDIEYNFITFCHRICIEMQEQAVNHTFVIANNTFMSYNLGFFGSYVTSTPCCQYGYTFGSNANINPAMNIVNNIEEYGVDGTTKNCGLNGAGSAAPNYVASGPCDLAVWGAEFWGNGSHLTNNMFQGQICTAVTPGYEGTSDGEYINYNTFSGPIMANPGNSSGTTQNSPLIAQCNTIGAQDGNTGPYYPTGGSYIATPENNSASQNPVKQAIGNVENGTPASVVSVAPTININGNIVTFTDLGYTSSTTPNPLGNTTIWYTLDGSTPVPGSGTAKFISTGGTINLSSPTTIKAVGMWGTPPQPTSYPSGFGFTPSAVQTASYSGGGSNQPTLTSISVTAASSSINVGATDQLTATGTYSDNSTQNLSSSVTWTPSNSNATVSSSGLLTGTTAGTVTVQATSGSIMGTSPTITINAVQSNPTLTGGGITQVNNINTIPLISGPAVQNLNTQNSLTNWSICVLPSCNPGGTNTPLGTSQTINNSSPSVSGASMMIAVTSPASSTQTNGLFVNKNGSCDECIYYTDDFYVYPTASENSYSTSLESDFFNFDVTDNLDFSFGGQCLLSTHVWQIANQTSNWTNTSASCSAMTTGSWHHLIIGAHRAGTNQVFDTLTIDGNTQALGMTLPATTLTTGYASIVGNQFQIDIGPTTASQTVNEYIDNINFTAIIGSTIQFQASGIYSDGVRRTLPDAYGNTAFWYVDNTTNCYVNQNGLLYALNTGTCSVHVTAKPSNIGFSSWGVTITSIPLPTGQTFTFTGNQVLSGSKIIVTNQ